MSRRAALLLSASTLFWTGVAMARSEGSPTAATATKVPAILEWKAAREKGVYGYLVYRATERDGPFLRVGREIVHVSADSNEVHSYRFEDLSIEAGKTYYYYLDKIATTGEKSRFSGVVTKVVPAD